MPEKLQYDRRNALISTHVYITLKKWYVRQLQYKTPASRVDYTRCVSARIFRCRDIRRPDCLRHERYRIPVVGRISHRQCSA